MPVTFKHEVGAELRGDECFFKVWAPNAQEVYVVFEKEQWQKNESGKLKETYDRYYEGVIKGVHENDKYRYLIIPKGSTCADEERCQNYEKIDPAAKDVMDDYLYYPENASVVVNPDYNWAPFDTPRFENFIIYQLHVGSFAGLNDDFGGEVAKLPNKVAKFKHVEAKLGYIKDMGFDAIEFLPVQESRDQQNWGYEPCFFFAPESAYGSPDDLRRLINESHKMGLAVIFDVVFNHLTGKVVNNSLENYDIKGQRIHLSNDQFSGGSKPDFSKHQVWDFFFDNIKMCFDMYNVDGIRFDYTNEIANVNRGWDFLKDLVGKIKQKYPNKYLIAEHFPPNYSDHDSIIHEVGFHATWFVAAHHELQKALDYEFHSYGHPLDKVKSVIGKNYGFEHNYPYQWNLIKSMPGSHDECGDHDEHSWQSTDINWNHQYLNQHLGGRDNWHARAKARLAWALNVASMGTPMIFMGTECHMPGFWNDHPEDHFNWAIAGDSTGMPMRQMVRAANDVRWNNPALRSEELQIVHEDYNNKIIAFKRWVPGGHNVVLVVANFSDRNFSNHDYNVRTGGQLGQWTQIFCSQDGGFGGWDGAGNAYCEPWTFDYLGDKFINLNVPKYSVVMMRLKE